MKYKKIFVFAGTGEGRKISEFLSELKKEHRVFVASEHGKKELTDSSCADVNVGRLDKDQMVSLFNHEEPDLIIDATHPFAIEVTQNIRQALKESGCQGEYVRINRSKVDISKMTDKYKNQIITVKNTEEAVDIMMKMAAKQRVLLTTGIKTAGEYIKADPDIAKNIYLRIIPSEESFREAAVLDFDMRHLIAMEGPFTKEMNAAIIRQYNIGLLITKNSGEGSGIREKLEACIDEGIKAIVIDAPFEDNGLSLEEVLTKLEGDQNKSDDSKCLAIVGIGMGDERSLTIAAAEKLKEAELIIGARRVIELVRKYNPKTKFKQAFKPEEVLQIYNRAFQKRIVFAVSGDTGFYSGAQKVSELFLKERIKHEIFPGVSSISYISSVAAMQYSDALIFSTHGKSDEEIEKMLEYDFNRGFCLKDTALFICSGRKDAEKIFDHVADAVPCMIRGGEVKIMVGYNMGMEDERYYVNDVNLDAEGLYVIAVYRLFA